MSVDKLVDSTQLDSDLTEVADEIRTAGGTLLPLSFPDDYVVAIGDIGNTEIKTASGSIAHFEDSLARKAQALTVAIEPVQSGSGDPSPDNVRPISGWTGANVTKTGKNLNPNQGNQFTTNNTSAFFLKAGTYTFSTSDGTELGSRNAIYFQLIDRNGDVITDGNMASPDLTLSGARIFYFGGQRKSSFSFDLLVDAYVKMGFANQLPSETYSIQLEVGSTATAYEPYQGDTYSITFPSEAGTVYGGTLDVTTGKLTVDRAMVDLGTLTWTYSGATGHERMLTEGIKTQVQKPASQSTKANILCSNFTTGTANNTYLHFADGVIAVSSSDGTLYVYWTGMGTDSSVFKTAMSGVQLVFELATPIVYDLDPVTVTTLLGTNNVWADTGDSTIKYIAPKAQIPSAQGVYF